MRSLEPMARIADESGSQPTAIHTPSNGLTTADRKPPAASARAAAAALPLGAGRRRAGRQPSRISTWTKRLPSGEGSGTYPQPPPGSPCSCWPVVRTTRALPSVETRTTWNQPSSSETMSRPEPSGSQRGPVSQADSPATSRSGRWPRRRRGSARSAGPAAAATSRRCGGRPATTRTRRCRRRSAVSGVGSAGAAGRGRPRRGTGASTSQS
jgi:hypothetical protein